MPDVPQSEAAVRLQQRLVELFVELCQDPDNAATATAVDQTLAELDDLMTRGER